MTQRRAIRAAWAACAAILFTALFLQAPGRGYAENAVVVPPPAMSGTKAAGATTQRAVLAGGCFWGSRRCSSIPWA